MLTHDQAKAAYGTARQHTRNPRETEFQLIGQITARIAAASSKPDNFPALASAIAENRTLWARIATFVSDDSNELPEALRAQLFYLYEFVTQHSSKVLNRTADASALIDINRSVMQGLASQAKAA